MYSSKIKGIISFIMIILLTVGCKAKEITNKSLEPSGKESLNGLENSNNGDVTSPVKSETGSEKETLIPSGNNDSSMGDESEFGKQAMEENIPEDEILIKKIREITIEDSIYDLEWSPDGKWIGYSTLSGNVYLINSDTWEQKHIFNGAEAAIENEDDYIDEGTIDSYERTEQPLYVIIKFSPTSNEIAIGNLIERTMYEYSLNTWSVSNYYMHKIGENTKLGGLLNFTLDRNIPKITDDFNIIFSRTTNTDASESVCLISFKGDIRKNLQAFNEKIKSSIKGEKFACFLSPDYKSLLTMSELGQINLWDMKTKTIKYNFSPPCPESEYTRYIIAVAFSEDSEFVYCNLCDEGSIWNVKTGDLEKVLYYPLAQPLQFSPNNQFLLGEWDFIDVWQERLVMVKENLNDDTLVTNYSWRMNKVPENISDISFSPNGANFVMGEKEGGVSIYKIISGK